MVRSLVIRQIFRLLDVVLAVAVIGAGAIAVRQFLSPMPAVEIADDLMNPESVETANLVRTPENRSAYDSLISSGLFGAAGRWDPDAAPPPPPEVPDFDMDVEIEESALNLVLKGTIALQPGDPFSVAFIENTEKRERPRSYLLGHEVVEDVFLETVYKREVILLNKQSEPPRRERLRMEEASPARAGDRDATQLASTRPTRAQPVPPMRRDASSTSASAPPASPIERITVNRAEIMQEMFENYATLSRMAPEIAHDESGNVLGVTASGIGQQPLARKLGFQENDIVQTVNNERIDSEQKILELVEKYQNANSFRVGILRNGRPHVLTFRLE